MRLGGGGEMMTVGQGLVAGGSTWDVGEQWEAVGVERRFLEECRWRERRSW